MMADYLVDNEGADMRLDRFIRRHMGPLGQGLIEKALRSGDIRVNGAKAKSSTRLTAGQTVNVSPAFSDNAPPAERQAPHRAPPACDSETADKELQEMTVCQTHSFTALNKPSGLAVQGGTGTRRHIDALLAASTLMHGSKLVHRIDKDTSGLLLVARTQTAARDLTRDFRTQQIKKIYLALTRGNPGKSGRIDIAIRKAGGRGLEKMIADEAGGQKAVTDFACLDSTGQVSLLALSPRTGRTHQLRVHCSHTDMPILGDGKYGGRDVYLDGFEKRLHLHAWGVRLADGAEVFAPLPVHFHHALAHAGLQLDSRSVFPLFGLTGSQAVI